MDYFVVSKSHKGLAEVISKIFEYDKNVKVIYDRREGQQTGKRQCGWHGDGETDKAVGAGVEATDHELLGWSELVQRSSTGDGNDRGRPVPEGEYGGGAQGVAKERGAQSTAGYGAEHLNKIKRGTRR
jgi:hypothetical protein